MDLAGLQPVDRQVFPALEWMRRPVVDSVAPGGPADSEILAGCLGDFRLIREIGRGGIGVVYEAQQLSLRRRVALKVMPLAAAVDPKQLKRFELEAQAAACLHHTNLLLDTEGRLWVTDFGLAQIQGNPGLTLTGDILGTLRYMSPEQALAKRVVIDGRTDIYSLGVTLYELLTLRPAIACQDRPEMLGRIADEEPRPLRQLNSAEATAGGRSAIPGDGLAS